jgi:hypothetical protein
MPSRQAFTPRTLPNPKKHPWKVRYSTSRKAYIVYIPAGAVAGVDLNLEELTKDKTLTDWYVVDVSTLEDSTKLVLYLYGDKASFTAPDPHKTDAEKPSFTCLIAELTDISGTPPDKIVVKQIVTSTISLGGGAASNIFPGPIQIEQDGDSLYLVQRWCRAVGNMYEFVELEFGTEYHDIGGTGCTTKYATRIRLFTHAEDHSEGLIKAWEPTDTAAQE